MGTVMKLLGAQWRHERPPFVDGCPTYADSARESSLIGVKVLEGVSGSHVAQGYTPIYNKVNCSGLLIITSGARASTVRYPAMKKRRKVPGGPFNGDVIRELRDRRQLSQDQLADLVGTTKANVSKWELARSYVAISYDLFMKLSRALYIAPEELAERLATPAAPGHSASSRASSTKRF